MLFFPRLVVQVLVYVFVFQNLVVQVLVFVILPRLGCPSFGLCCFFQDLVVQVLVYVLVLPRLGCPSFGFSCARLHGVRGGSTGQHQTA